MWKVLERFAKAFPDPGTSLWWDLLWSIIMVCLLGTSMLIMVAFLVVGTIVYVLSPSFRTFVREHRHMIFRE